MEGTGSKWLGKAAVCDGFYNSFGIITLPEDYEVVVSPNWQSMLPCPTTPPFWQAAGHVFISPGSKPQHCLQSFLAPQ